MEVLLPQCLQIKVVLKKTRIAIIVTPSPLSFSFLIIHFSHSNLSSHIYSLLFPLLNIFPFILIFILIFFFTVGAVYFQSGNQTPLFVCFMNFCLILGSPFLVRGKGAKPTKLTCFTVFASL